MKRWLFLAYFPIALFAQDAFEPQFDVAPPQAPPFFPFSLSGSYLSVAEATFHTPDVEGQQLKYEQYDTGLSYTHPCSEKWGFIFGAGWIGTEVAWDENPDFNQTRFNYINASFGGFTKAYPRWTWTAVFGMFFDTEEFSLADYTLYQVTIWGKYEWFPCFEFDVGFILELGLDKQKMWPIFGFVYNMTEKWHLNAIYPILINMNYDFLRYWNAGIGLQFLRNRHRVTNSEPNPQSIFEYHTIGYEGNLSFKPSKNINIEGFIGSTFRGDLKITNRHDKHGRHFKFDAAPYTGVNGVLSF